MARVTSDTYKIVYLNLIIFNCFVSSKFYRFYFRYINLTLYQVTGNRQVRRLTVF